MNEQQIEEARDLYEDHMARMAEDHALRMEEVAIAGGIQDVSAPGPDTPAVNEVAVQLADALYARHGSYPAALMFLCDQYVTHWGEPSIKAMIESVYRDIETDDLF